MSLPLEMMETLAVSFVFVWLFCLGATVGSFLNVVVWRLPRGISLVHPGSFCPVCRHPIHLRDNIPVLSWLALRGRCRDCATPIPRRYLWVELATGTMFLCLAAWRTLGPTADLRSLDPRWLLSWELAGQFWIDYLRDVILLSTLLAAALIEADGFVIPWRLWWPACLIAVGVPWIEGVFNRIDNSLVVIGPRPRLYGPPGPPWVLPWVGLGLGLAMGGALEGVRQFAAGRRGLAARPLGGALATTGASLNWQAMLTAGCGGMVMLVLGRIAGRNIPTAAAVGGMVVSELLGGEGLRWAGRWFWGLEAISCAALALVAAGVLGRLERCCLPQVEEPEEPAAAPSPPLEVDTPPPTDLPS